MKRKIAVCFLSFIFIFSSAGCWSNNEASEMNISSALGLDRSEDGKIMVSVQLIIPSAFKASSSGISGEKKDFIVVSNTGDTLFAAIRGMLSKINKKVYYGSLQVIVISEEVAKFGIKDFMDFILRDHEFQYDTLIVVAKGSTAKEILEEKPELSKTSALFIKDSFENTKYRAFTKDMSLLEVTRELFSPGKSLAVGTIKKTGDEIVSEGMAVFLKDKMVGEFDSLETRGYMFALGQVKSTILEIENPLNPKKKVNVEVFNASRERKVDWTEEDKPIINIKIKVQGNIGEQQDGEDVDEEEFMKMVTEKCNEEIKNEATKAIKKAQKEFKSDIFGFGYTMQEQNNKYWKKVKNQWHSDIFPEQKVNIVVDTKLNRTGLIHKSLAEQ